MRLGHQTALTLELHIQTGTRNGLKEINLLPIKLLYKYNASYSKLNLAKGVYLIIGLFDENFAIMKQHHLLYLL